MSLENPYIAQEWLYGNGYCTYGLFRKGEAQAFVIYPVVDTIDGSSAVFFEAVAYDRIKEYVLTLAHKLQLTGQLAFDFIKTGVPEGDLHRVPSCIAKSVACQTLGQRKTFSKAHLRPKLAGHEKQQQHQQQNVRTPTCCLVCIECNPRSTSGIHLWSGTSKLAVMMTDLNLGLPEVAARAGRARQAGAGMLMWEHKQANTKRYFQHLGRLLSTKDVLWSWHDLTPWLMQPFLLASYYQICHTKGGMSLPEMFQSDLVW